MSGKVNKWKLFLLLLIPVALVATYYFATKNSKNVICSDVIVNINFKTEKQLITEQDVYKILKLSEGKKSLIGKYSDDLNFSEMERTLLKNKSIKKADIYISLSGDIIMEITQRNPILRVIPDGFQSYYLCDDEQRMPLSKNFTPDLIPVTGVMNDKIDRKLYCVVGFVNNNSFWKEQIEQFFVDANENISFIPFTGVHEVILGDTTDLDEKFKKLEIFYKKGLSKIGWNKYKSVNLKFKGQVICK